MLSQDLYMVGFFREQVYKEEFLPKTNQFKPVYELNFDKAVISPYLGQDGCVGNKDLWSGLYYISFDFSSEPKYNKILNGKNCFNIWKNNVLEDAFSGTKKYDLSSYEFGPGKLQVSLISKSWNGLNIEKIKSGEKTIVQSQHDITYTTADKYYKFLEFVDISNNKFMAAQKKHIDRVLLKQKRLNSKGI